MDSSTPLYTKSLVKEHLSEEHRSSIAELSIHSLRVELRRRNLSTIGVRSELESRLAHDLARCVASASKVSGLRSPSGICRGQPVIRRRRRLPSTLISVPPRFPEDVGPFSKLAHDVKLVISNVCQPGVPKASVQNLVSKTESRTHTWQVTGVVRGRAVWIMGQAEMNSFWEAAGPCGKANLSRSAPSYNVHQALPASALKGRAMRQLLEMEGSEATAQCSHEDGSDSEHLQLTLVEAFYSSFITKLVRLKDMGGQRLTDPNTTWSLFSARLPRFPQLFVAYCRYRSTGWLPRSGIKYGVDWVLYPASSKNHSHAPYCIILRFDTDAKASQIDSTWIRLQNRLRLVKNVAKTLVIANIQVEDGANLQSFKDAFGKVKITEMTIDRWIP